MALGDNTAFLLIVLLLQAQMKKKIDFLALFNQRLSLQLAVGGRAVHAEQGSTTTGEAVRGLCGEHSAVKKGPGLCVA